MIPFYTTGYIYLYLAVIRTHRISSLETQEYNRFWFHLLHISTREVHLPQYYNYAQHPIYITGLIMTNYTSPVYDWGAGRSPQAHSCHIVGCTSDLATRCHQINCLCRKWLPVMYRPHYFRCCSGEALKKACCCVLFCSSNGLGTMISRSVIPVDLKLVANCDMI